MGVGIFCTKGEQARHEFNVFLIYSCMLFLFIITIPKFFNFAIFAIAYHLFLQYCTAPLGVNTVIQFSNILFHLQDKTFSF